MHSQFPRFLILVISILGVSHHFVLVLVFFVFFGAYSLDLLIVVSLVCQYRCSAVDWLEMLVFEMTFYVSSCMLNCTPLLISYDCEVYFRTGHNGDLSVSAAVSVGDAVP